MAADGEKMKSVQNRMRTQVEEWWHSTAGEAEQLRVVNKWSAGVQPNVVLQCVAVCFSVCYSVIHCVAVCYSVLQCVAVCCSVLQCVAACCSVLQCVASLCKRRVYDFQGPGRCQKLRNCQHCCAFL